MTSLGSSRTLLTLTETGEVIFYHLYLDAVACILKSPK